MRDLTRIDSSVNQFSARFHNSLKSSIIMMKYENTKGEKKTRILLSFTHQYNVCASLYIKKPAHVCASGACSLRYDQKCHGIPKKRNRNLSASQVLFLRDCIVISPTWSKITSPNISSLACLHSSSIGKKSSHFFRWKIFRQIGQLVCTMYTKKL